MAKRATSVKISDEARELLKRLAETLHISQAAVMEMAVREFAKKQGVKRETVD